MSNYLIFIDLDGTLRNSSRQISTQTKEILKKTIDKNTRSSADTRCHPSPF